MYQIINTEFEKYLKSLPDIEDPVIRKMEEYAAKNDFPIIGREGGKLLHLITKIKNPSLVVEMGSGFGYSGYFFAKALKKGKVVLIDYLDRNINLAKDFFKEGKLIEKAQFRVGDAVQIGQEYKNIDILFLDLEKVRYLEAVKTVEKNLSEGGIIIADNVLYQGKVLFEKEDRKAKVLDSFNRYMFENYFSVIIPIRDGILLGVKKEF